MGIQNLNRYLRNNCHSGVKNIPLSSLAGKRIVIDTSIYLYRFIGEGDLIENMYNLISIFKNYNIIPIFIFEGVPPIEKEEIIKKRRTDRISAEIEYTYLKNNGLEDTNLDKLRRKAIKVRYKDINDVKYLMDCMGVEYLTAMGESDELCAKLVIKGHAYACLTEDMDMFVYGCPIILRYLSLINRKVVAYNLETILSELSLSFCDFQDICILSGTDYHIKNNKINLYKVINYFNEYKEININDNFYEWLESKYKVIENIYELYMTKNMFDLCNVSLKDFKKIKWDKVGDRIKMEEFLKMKGFIFLKKDKNIN